MRSALSLRAAPSRRAPNILRRLPGALALALVLGLAPAGEGQAQTPGTEDLRALIYYLDNDDQRSVQAEMRRLRAAFPHWSPPTDLNRLRAQASPPSASADTGAIWGRIERADYAGARALIEETRRNVPGWSPDAEMLRVLDLNEGQAAFDAAVARRDLAGGVAAARRVPALMRCDRINNAWLLAEMYHAAGQTENALATYRGTLSSCTRADQAVPTLEKANDIANLAQITALFETARAAAPGNARVLNDLEARLRAGRGAPATTARATPAPAAPAPAAPARPAAPVAAAPAPSAAPVASAVPPSNLPLRGDNRIARVRSLKEAGDWANCLAASTEPRSIEVLYERSWCAYNHGRGGEALSGFTTTARQGGALGGNVQRDAQYGMILTYLSFNMTEEAARWAAATNLTRDQRVEVEAIILDQRGVRSYHARDYAQAVAYFDALEALTGTLRRDLAMLRGYAHINLRNYDLARAQFTLLHRQLATDETRNALAGLAARGQDGD